MISSNVTELKLYIDDGMNFVFSRGDNSYKLNIDRAVELGLFVKI